MVTRILVNTGSSNGLLPDSIKPLHLKCHLNLPGANEANELMDFNGTFTHIHHGRVTGTGAIVDCRLPNDSEETLKDMSKITPYQNTTKCEKSLDTMNKVRRISTTLPRKDNFTTVN